MLTFLFFLINPFVETHTELEGVTIEIRWQWLILSFGVLLLYRSAYVQPFVMLLRVLDSDTARLPSTPMHTVSFRTAFALFHLANITRYLPGRIWGVIRLLSLSHRFGLRKTTTVSSLTLHVGIETALGGLIGMSLIFSPKVRDTALGMLDKISGHTTLLSLACLGILIGTLFLMPKVSVHAREFLKTLTSLRRHSRLWTDVIVRHILLWKCQGLAFFLFVKSFVPVAWTDVAVLAACFAFAWVIGFLSFLTPGGLGIREGLLGLLLANYMPASQATLVALLCRVWMLSAEIVLAGAAFYLRKKSNFEHKCN